MNLDLRIIVLGSGISRVSRSEQINEQVYPALYQDLPDMEEYEIYP